MARKLKHREFHFNLSVLFRWIFFALIIYFSINFLSGNKSSLNTNLDPNNLNILGINSQPVIIKATQTFDESKKHVIKYVNDQLIDIKKQIVTKLYQEVIKSIEHPQQ